MTKIHLVSDLHLEFEKVLPTFPNDIDFLILAGDLGKPFTDIYQKLIKLSSKSAKHVILISGNHEYYSSNKDYNKINNKIQETADLYENVHFLNNKSIELFGFRIIGTTFWSHVPKQHHYKIASTMNDYNHIKIKDGNKINPDKTRLRKICIDQTQLWHNTAYNFLKTELEKQDQLPTIIATHHAPLLKYIQDPLDHAYYTDIGDLDLSSTVLWAYGHTHTQEMKEIDVTLFWSNPRGYPKEKTGYEEMATIEI